ncbi:conserved hypothetical protein [Leptothrix cholodnii SP-6]|uniref:Toprim domain-containing protein n=1 Tax=Leptothrix cholodnii (strain ATCC 51168 / LMG 8142 / SP-6) TaxID=395495 RepID=B1XZ75_LEPCP|nr:toprim domain-containing protein [Leptothrix cholodnii]ACB35245.1 conserved hypothetical protein [Leptothrix cholodnii SP-6]
MSAADHFEAFMRSVGLAPAKPLNLTDGKLERFRVEGDKSGSRNGWAVMYSHPDVWGVVGSWRTGEQHSWRELVRQHMTAQERRQLQLQREQATAARLADQQRAHAEAQAKALKLWRLARPAIDAHPYLQRKRVHAYGLRQLGERLLVPARDRQGELHTLQFIDADGTKRFLTGGRIGGCYCAIGEPRDGLLVCEGYATAATLFDATGIATAAAFSAGNLARVAVALRSKFPQARIGICGDRDDSGTGQAAAIEAARAVGGLVALPTFGGSQ